MARSKVSRVLFFLNGALATEAEKAMAEAVRAEGYDVAYRNANFVGTGGLEEAQAVAGAVPAVYRESGKYEMIGEITQPTVETREASATSTYGGQPPITTGYPGNFAAPIVNENGRDIRTANESPDAVERARRSVNIPGVDYTQAAPLSTSPNAAPAVRADTADGQPENGTAGPSTSEEGRALEQAVRDGAPNPATGGNEGSATGGVGKLDAPAPGTASSTGWGASPARPTPSGAGWSPNGGSGGAPASERPAADATNAVLAAYLATKTGVPTPDNMTKAELNAAIDNAEKPAS